MAEKGVPKRGMGPKTDHSITRAEVKQGAKKRARQHPVDQQEIDEWWASTTRNGRVKGWVYE